MAGTPRVEAIFTAPAAAEQMERRTSVELVPGLGIPGDRYATGQGHWSDPRWPDQELTLVEAELLESLGLPLDAMRRNVVTRGIDLASLEGVDFSIGEVLLRGVRPCEPCRYVERFSRAGLFSELQGRGGLRSTILTSGDIHQGAALSVLTRPA
jgi:MOSC domain-containing protein YiiM